jgi:hypothetical protein
MRFAGYDPKPAAPSEFRRPLGTVPTSIPGVHFCEVMAKQAAIMDKLAVIRSITHGNNSHGTSSHLTQTGYYQRGRNGGNSFPCVGSVAAKLIGSNVPGVPPYTAVRGAMSMGRAAFLGNAFDPLETGDPNKKNFEVKGLSPCKGLTVERLEYRKALTETFDAAHRVVDTAGVAEAMDSFQHQAFDVLLGGRARDAFDISQEDERTRDAYGRNSLGQSMLLARRLIEAGVTFVTARIGGWDDHNKIEDRMKQKGPQYDQGVAALVTDLHERGLDQDVLVVAMGEFGRTPRINKTAGRDHWGKLMSVLVAGGGLSMGQIIGESNSRGEEPIDAPYGPENVLAMVYRHLGIDPSRTIKDLTGRPRFLLEEKRLIKELV